MKLNRVLRLGLFLSVILLLAPGVWATNTVVEFTTSIPDTICPGVTLNVCVNLSQPCGGGLSAPLAGRTLLFFLNEGNCGADVGQAADDTVITDANGNACSEILIPATKGGDWSVRAQFSGESKPGTTEPPNSACDTTSRVQLSASSVCEVMVIDPAACSSPPTITCSGDADILQCSFEPICLTGFTVSDIDGDLDSAWIFFGTLDGDSVCFTPTYEGVYEIIYNAVDLENNFAACTTSVTVTLNSAPTVLLEADTSIFLCIPEELCFPVDVLDVDCDLVSISTNTGQYSGSVSSFDQVARLNELGGTVTQVGGGAPGATLNDASDFVGTISSQTGVAVTLSTFDFAYNVIDYGTFPSGITPANSADHLLGSPTDLTFTAVGAGGPDGGDGDGSINFSTGDYCGICFGHEITTCDGANVDVIIFTNTAGGGSVELEFMLNHTVVETITRTLPSGVAGSGIGGVTLDLDDGLTFNQIMITSISGIVEIDAIAARLLPSSSSSDICFTPDTSGVYELEVTALDACGNSSTAYQNVTVSLNTAPVANAGADLSFFQCNFEEICFDVSFSDVDDNLSTTELLAGPGSLVGNQICYTPTGTGSSTFIIKATDACGLEDIDTVSVTVSTNSVPIAVDPSTVIQSMCVPIELCHDFTATDVDGGTLTWTYLVGVGTISTDGHFCFTPTVSGTYSAAVIVTDSCGLADTTSILYDLTINSAPVATEPSSPVDLSQCVAEEVCSQFEANDPESDDLTWTLLTGPGSLSVDGLWCFTPTASESYEVSVAVVDPCGLADTVGLVYNITLNDAPTVAFDADTVLSLCVPQEICVNYTPNDPQGLTGVTEELLTGFGTLDTDNNQVCFTPTTGGCYDIIVRVTDPCGVTDEDTISVCVSFGDLAQIVCPNAPINMSLCEPGNVCLGLPITPSSAIVFTSQGTYNSGQICFDADTSGTYIISVVAQAECGSDTCQLIFNVDIGQAAQIDCPAPTSKFICVAGSVCLSVGIFGSGVAVAVSPIGTYSSGNLCFIADTSGHYEILVVATTNCGIDSCLAIADVIINSPPVATDPSPVDTFMCATAEICYQFAATDPDGGSLTYARLSGVGTVTSDGRWCFPGTNGSHSVDVVVSDSCGAADTTTMTYNVTINSAPVVDLGDDITKFICTSGFVCQYFTVTDADDNLSSVELIWGAATLDTAQKKFCFDPQVSGVYEFVLKATDACGAENYDTLFVTIDINDTPIVDAGDDLTIFDCSIQEICWSSNVSDPDGNLTSVELIEGTGTYDGSSICFTPTGTDNYEFILKATDFCGAESVDTIMVYFTLNAPPTADAGSDQVLFLCTMSEICWPVSCSDVDGNLSDCSLIFGPGTYSGSDICFTPTASGTYEFILRATDGCGLTTDDTVTIDVTINSAPVCSVPNDTTIFQCVATEVCLPAFGTDVDGNLNFCQIISGPGVISGGDWCYTPAADQAVEVTLRCEDSCGAFCESSFTVEFNINESPSIAFGNDTSFFLCESQEVCLPYVAFDPDEPCPITISLLSGPGSLDEAGSRVCFTPTVSGTYTFVIRIEDECGVFVEDTITVDITLNSPPVVDAGSDQSHFVCDPGTEICWPAICSDPDGNNNECVLIGPGSYDGTSICFNPTSSGVYDFILETSDDCGLFASDTVSITVTNNSDPTIVVANDTSLFLCTQQEICFGYSVSDPDGSSGLVESMVSGYGSLDTVNNEVCFTPTADGCYEFVLRVTDSCGAVSLDTVEVCVTFGSTVMIECPTQPIEVSLCQPDTVCHALTISPATADVTVSFGTYTAGVLCFPVDSSGVYNITVVASESCGANTCLLTFNVDIGDTVYVDCPAPSAQSICTPGNVCVDVGIYGSGAAVTVSPIGSFSAGEVCFFADTTGHYVLSVHAETACGSDDCQIVVDVTLNSAPYVEEMAPVDTLVCEPGSLCCPFATHVQDDDNDDLSFSRLSGDGTVNAEGEWCFNVPVSGTYTVCALVSDDCNAVDTICHTYNVIVNTVPYIAFDSKATTSLCKSDTICATYTVTDPDDNGVVEQLLSAFGTIDTVTNEVCFFADTSGDYTLIVGATDDCGSSYSDTKTITVQINTPPVANAGDDQTIFQCNQTEICWPASCSDPDDNLDSCYLTEGVGIYAAGHICFTPDGSGDYTFVLRSVDVCGAFDEDTVKINVTINSAPVCDVAGDTAYFQCSPTQVSRRVTGTDIDGNFDHCEIITGPGSIIDSFWVYTPTADQSVTVQVMCLDDCGSYCEESFTVNFNLNTPPVVDAGEDKNWFMCAPKDSCWSVTASDEDGNLSTVELIDGPAGAIYNAGTGDICFSVPAGNASYTFVVKATDVCGAVVFDTTTVTIQYNSPPTMDLINNMTVYMEEMGEVCYPVAINDVDGNLSSVYTSLGTYDPGTEQICFTADSSGTYCMIVSASDVCEETVVDTVCVTVVIDECIHVRIEKTHNAIQGQIETVGVYLYGSGKELGGYDILVAYDQSALSVQSVEPGVLHIDCGWEYFNFRYGDDGNCGTGCPSGLLRIVALAETNNGANHPGCFLENMVGTLADINFMVSDDRTLECQFAPVSFFWMDCGDNGFSGKYGDTLWISRNVYNFEHQNITDVNYDFPGYFGAPNQCLIGGDPDKPTPLRCVDFTNGGVDIVCADSIDARADINLNGVAYEVADAVVFSNYFVYGLSVFNVNTNGQIAATDVNADGISLSVADLVYLIRVIVGDTPPMPKIAPGQTPQAQLGVKGGVLSVIESDYRIGAISLILEGEVEPQLHENAQSMQMRYNYDGERTRVLIYNMDGQSFLETGPVLHVGSNVNVVSFDVGSYDGFTLAGKIKELPEDFHLAQNYPNPFNPSTTFEFALPVAAEWKLVVYNVLGQTVRTWYGENDAGYVRVDWDASSYASGVYFYRLQANNFSSTKKMVLLK